MQFNESSTSLSSRELLQHDEWVKYFNKPWSKCSPSFLHCLGRNVVPPALDVQELISHTVKWHIHRRQRCESIINPYTETGNHLVTLDTSAYMDPVISTWLQELPTTEKATYAKFNSMNTLATPAGPSESEPIVNTNESLVMDSIHVTSMNDVKLWIQVPATLLLLDDVESMSPDTGDMEWSLLRRRHRFNETVTNKATFPNVHSVPTYHVTSKKCQLASA